MISYKAAVPPNSNSDVISDVLFTANMMESRVMVVHVNPDTGMRIFSVANTLQMMASGYVWIVTDWLAAVLDSLGSGDLKDMSHIQGLIVLRQHTPESDAKNKFISKWNTVARNKNITYGLNSYGFYAYDTVWTVARAINEFLNSGQHINFSTDPRLYDSNGSTLNFQHSRYLTVVILCCSNFYLTNFTGVTGPVQFGSDSNLATLPIVRNGTAISEYTQPYVEAGLVIVAPVKHVPPSAWAFLKPFHWRCGVSQILRASVSVIPERLPLAADMSTAILQLSESGQLQRIHDEWFSQPSCTSDDDSQVGATRLGVGSFSGLFLMCALICLFALVVFSIRICWQYNQYSNSEAASDSEPSAADADAIQRKTSGRGSFKDLLQFVDKKEEEIRRTIKRKSSDKDNQAVGSSSGEMDSSTAALVLVQLD
ncbi:hypothetical protein HU200_008461 [Digitaria exilis]|uniref:Receptor ligand binding region domain-containing protein n=1 Tax=Digitaria exilis TaxID=1010633 RepID=A0A835FMI3_9POAL|nr:hypothetical protein HU200_008461 [Digitaria exilis]